MPESKKFLLRIDPGLFDVLRHWADDELRSINAQIEYLLTDQARRAGRLPKQRAPRPSSSDLDDELDELIEETRADSHDSLTG